VFVPCADLCWSLPWLCRWEATKTTELVPGDLFSLIKTKENDVVPCDCLLLRGSAVVNEATLTGESIPQMKDAVHAGGADEVLNIKGGASKVHVLFGGTRLLQISTGSQAAESTAETFEEEERAAGEAWARLGVREAEV
jgi:manganese-transporting P-type ATPase